jgi:hypothetical protein
VSPPQTIILEPVQTAVWVERADGAPDAAVAVQEQQIEVLAISVYPAPINVVSPGGPSSIEPDGTPAPAGP